ncbi:MAG: phosphoribosylanthranilate isomerase [Acidobacteriota bacterium]|nr:phosphoribosylanthranilate isomerase [Acidobacteriota bacterium]
MTKVKICGITNLEDALISAKFGADALGFNFYEKSSRYIAPEKAREIIEQLPKEILKVGVFVNESLDKIAEIASIAKLGALQLHGEETPEFARELKAKTNLEIIKAFRVSPEFKPEDVLQYEVDAVLLDAYSRHEHGGTGETFDWEIAKKVQKIFPKMYLAGGLLHENVYRAIYDTKAFTVDICSGIEEIKGKKDKIKLINFISKSKKIIRKTPQSLYGLLDVMQLYPTMVVGLKSLTFINRYLSGFESAIKLSKSNFNTGKFFIEFDQFVQRKFNEDRGALGWNLRILEKVNFDEEKAVDLFFALLEEFKLEKEDLGEN